MATGEYRRLPNSVNLFADRFSRDNRFWETMRATVGLQVRAGATGPFRSRFGISGESRHRTDNSERNPSGGHVARCTVHCWRLCGAIVCHKHTSSPVPYCYSSSVRELAISADGRSQSYAYHCSHANSDPPAVSDTQPNTDEYTIVDTLPDANLHTFTDPSPMWSSSLLQKHHRVLHKGHLQIRCGKRGGPAPGRDDCGNVEDPGRWHWKAQPLWARIAAELDRGACAGLNLSGDGLSLVSSGRTTNGGRPLRGQAAYG